MLCIYFSVVLVLYARLKTIAIAQAFVLLVWLRTVVSFVWLVMKHSLHFVPSGVAEAEGDGRAALQQIQRDRLGPTAPAG